MLEFFIIAGSLSIIAHDRLTSQKKHDTPIEKLAKDCEEIHKKAMKKWELHSKKRQELMKSDTLSPQSEQKKYENEINAAVLMENLQQKMMTLQKNFEEKFKNMKISK